MSGVQKAIGREIERYMYQQQYAEQGLPTYKTVGQVAAHFEISKQTARKYLNILVDTGRMYKVQSTGKGGKFYGYHYALDEMPS